MPEPLASTIISAAVAFGAALGVVLLREYLAAKRGLSDVDLAVREQRGALVVTLTARVKHLEEENASLKADNELMKREIASLRDEVSRLQRHIIENDIARSRDA